MARSKFGIAVDIMSMSDEVTGSCTVVIVKLRDGSNVRFIVDCGLYQEKEYQERNKKLGFKAENVDFCLVTHNHVDHIGRIPLLVKKGFSNPIYATETTSKLMPLALADSFKVLKNTAKVAGEKSLYLEKDVDKTISQIVPVKYYSMFKPSSNIKVTFLKNGHLMGAALILVEISDYECENVNLLFTGDYAKNNSFFDVRKLPSRITELPLNIICESTYGDFKTEKIKKCYTSNVAKHIKKTKGIVLSPVFSLGRSQEILYEYKKMQDKGKIDSEVPIFLDGKLTQAYTNLFLQDGLDIKKSMLNFMPQNVTYVNKANRQEIIDKKGPKIILTSSGMGTYGPAQTYIQNYISNSNALIHFTGYTADGTLGSKLKEAGIGELVKVNSVIRTKKARIEYTSEFSAHAKADELINFLSQFANIKTLIINHGTEEAKKAFAQEVLKEDFNIKNICILDSKYYFKLNSYGLIKTLPTKFE